jgi:hypothetical protein
MIIEAGSLPYSEVFGPEKVKRRTPFPIRAHHLDKFASASPTGQSIRMILVGNSFLELKDSVASTVEYIQKESDREYRKDVFGEDENPDAFNTRMRGVMTLFYVLPEDYPVIVSSGKDVICDSCIVGKHCDRMTWEGFGVEMAYMRLLIDSITLSRAFEAEDQGVVFQILLDRQNAQNKQTIIPSLQTEVGTLKKAFIAMAQIRAVEARAIVQKSNRDMLIKKWG